MTAVARPRKIKQAWNIVRYGLPTDGRYRRYLLTLAPILLGVWTLTGLYLTLAPTRYASRTTFILPGSGSGGSMNVESIGQASATTASAFSSPTLSPTENYKRLLSSDVVLTRAGALAHDADGKFPEPTIKLTDQTNLIEVTLTGGTPTQARVRGEALRAAFLADLDRLRSDEATKREAADRTHIEELKGKVRDAQRRLLAFQGATGLVSLEQFTQRITALDTLHDRERLAQTAERQQTATTGQLARALGISTSGARAAFLLKADPLFQSLLTRYAAAATATSEKAAMLGPRHATIVELDATSGALRAALVGRGTALTGLPASTLLSFADLSVTEGRARMFETMVGQTGQVAGAEAALGEIRRQIAEQTTASGNLVRDAATLADLIREARIAEAVFSSALARVDTNKADPFASYPLVQTLEEPSLQRKKMSPSTPLALAGAIGASLFILVGFGLLWLRQPIIHRMMPSD